MTLKKELHNSHQLSKDVSGYKQHLVMLKFNSENLRLTFNWGSFVLGNDREDTNKERMKE